MHIDKKTLRELAQNTLEQSGPNVTGTASWFRARATELATKIVELLDGDASPIPMRLHCPECGELHIDEGAFETKPHHTHACQNCGAVWRPAIVPTVGVRFLPGFKNGSPAPARAQVDEYSTKHCACGVRHRLGEFKPGARVRTLIGPVAGAHSIPVGTVCIVREWSQIGGPIYYRVHVEGDEANRANYDPCELEAMPICSTCNDTHRMSLGASLGDAPCTRCPTPCADCRAGGNGPYCSTTPCACECHRRTR